MIWPSVWHDYWRKSPKNNSTANCPNVHYIFTFLNYRLESNPQHFRRAFLAELARPIKPAWQALKAANFLVLRILGRNGWTPVHLLIHWVVELELRHSTHFGAV